MAKEWVSSDDEIWVDSDDEIWIPIIVNGKETFLSFKKEYFFSTNSHNYTFQTRNVE